MRIVDTTIGEQVVLELFDRVIIKNVGPNVNGKRGKIINIDGPYYDVQLSKHQVVECLRSEIEFVV